jgi:hypothetical protein
MVSKNKPKSFERLILNKIILGEIVLTCIYKYVLSLYIIIDLKMVYPTIWNIVADYIVLCSDKVVSYNCFYCIYYILLMDYFYICGDSFSPVWIA